MRVAGHVPGILVLYINVYEVYCNVSNGKKQ